MNLRDLEYFYQLAKSKSYTGTAQHFKVSQPTISYAIKRLEKELDCDLVIKDPSHRTAELTLQGDIFQSHVEDVLLQIKNRQVERNNRKIEMTSICLLRKWS